MADSCELGNDLSSSLKCGELLTSYGNASFSRNNLVNGVND
jgi:hypothetical protein